MDFEGCDASFVTNDVLSFWPSYRMMLLVTVQPESSGVSSSCASCLLWIGASPSSAALLMSCGSPELLALALSSGSCTFSLLVCSFRMMSGPTDYGLFTLPPLPLLRETSYWVVPVSLMLRSCSTRVAFLEFCALMLKLVGAPDPEKVENG